MIHATHNRSIAGPVRPRARMRRAMTYVELLVSFAIIGTAVTASLKAISSYGLGARIAADRTVSLELATQLMAEINALPYVDSGGGTSLGIETGETLANRTTFDDIDDYDNYTESPPTDRTGNVLSEYTGFRRAVTVVYDTSLAARTGRTLSATAFKRITVIVSKDGREVVRLVTVRSANHASS
jgi:type II secretory pathway pseudopilin PulG